VSGEIAVAGPPCPWQVRPKSLKLPATGLCGAHSRGNHMLTAFDVGVGVLVLISAILATARGLTREVLSLATWAGSAAIAVYMYFNHTDLAKQYIQEPIVAEVATVVVSFIVA